VCVDGGFTAEMCVCVCESVIYIYIT
jgi:hypothetical protein